MTQNEKILEYLKTGKIITAYIAFAEFNCMRLAARIADLRRMGYNIKSRLVTKKNIFGESITYAEYWLETEEEEGEPNA